ncbi:MAG: hypothetical protein QNJ70_24610 [Xenococcaceae cyanobacterium MO_207.B15]|nr:hypothetical protein [Xenococcaceae cyanobacterium MO_207.B15]
MRSSIRKPVKKSLSTRTHVCSCGYTEDRDIAASIGIFPKRLCTVGYTGTYPTRDLPSWSSAINLLANGESMNVESPTKINVASENGIIYLVVGVSIFHTISYFFD